MTQTFVPGARPGRAWIAASAATLGTIAIPAVWLLNTSTGNLREELKACAALSLDACVLLGLLIGVCLLHTIPRVAREILPQPCWRHSAWR
jgi:hypothetical protein